MVRRTLHTEDVNLEDFVSPQLELHPHDLLDYEPGDSKGEPVSFRLNPKLLHTMDILIQHGRETSGMPRTRSDFIRLCTTQHLRRLMRAGLPEDWDKVPLLRALKEEFEIGQFADGAAERVKTLKRSLEKVRQVVNEHLADLEFELAADVAEKYFGLIERYKQSEPKLGSRLVRQIQRDDVFLESISRINRQGFGLEVPQIDDG